MDLFKRVRKILTKEENPSSFIADQSQQCNIICKTYETGLRWSCVEGQEASDWIFQKTLYGLTEEQRLILLQAIEGGCAICEGPAVFIANQDWFLLYQEERQSLVQWQDYDGSILLNGRGMLYQETFRYSLSFRDLTGRLLVGACPCGCTLSYGNRIYMFNQAQYEVISLVNEQNKAGNSSEAESLRRFARIKELAENARVELDQYLSTEEAVLVERVGVFIQESPTGQVLVEPLIHGDKLDEELNRSFAKHSQISHRYDLSQGNGGRRRIIFSAKAEEGLRQIKDVALWSEQARQSLLSKPTAPFDPDIVSFEDIHIERYSERVSGIVEHESGLAERSPFRVEWLPEDIDLVADQQEGSVFEPNSNSTKKEDKKSEHHILQVDEWLTWENETIESTQFNRPPFLRQEINLLPHQEQGIIWLQGRFRSNSSIRGALLADDMGLGKTLQILSFLMTCREEKRCKGESLLPDLIVAPVVLLDNWQDEIEKFFIQTPDILVLHGKNLKELRRPGMTYGQEYRGVPRVTLNIEPIQQAGLVLTTYDTVRDYQFSLGLVSWGMIVADEAQRVKNPHSLSSLALRAMKADFRIACTATPVENSLIDLWSLSDFAVPGLLGTQEEFRFQYQYNCNGIEDSVDIRKNDHPLRRAIQPVILRRMKEDILKNLPQKKERTCTVPLKPLQRKQYLDVLTLYKKEKMSPEIILKILHYLRNVCSSPYLSREENSLEEIYQQNGKIEMVVDILKEIAVKQEKVIIFTERKEWQRLIAQIIQERYSLFVSIINGDVPGTNRPGAVSRKKIIDNFRSQKGFGVLILSPVAAGYGITLTEANHVIHFSRLWNPAKEDQATDRVYRIGQDKTVYVYYLVSVDPNGQFVTFDERLAELLHKKRKMAKDVLEPSDSWDVHPSDFSDLISNTLH